MVESFSKTDDFRSVFPVAVEAGLKEIIGESAMKVILSSFPDITTSPEKLDEILMRIFGEGGRVLRESVLAHVSR